MQRSLCAQSVIFAATAGLSGPALLAQHCDPPADLILANLAGEQVQPKAASVVDAADYVAWFDNASGGYDVRLQRLDARGNETFAHNGLLIADRNFSSTQDYGLATDAAGHALLAFRDDRFGGVRITAQRIAPDGSMPWGPGGVQFANGSDFVASPKIAATSDGHVVVAWTNESTVRLQRLDASGNVLWMSDVVLSDPNASLSLCDLKPALDGGVIASWVRSASFNSPKHLYAQRLDADGNLLWGANHVAVFDGGSLQFGNFPPMVSDGSGGAVFAWYSTSGSLQCFVQRLDADGNEVFPHNGVPVSINPLQDRVSPSAAFDSNTGETYVFWMEQRNAQSERGVYGQRFDASGARQWGDNGVVIRPVSPSTDFRSINAAFTAGGAMASFIESAGFGNDAVRAAGLDPAGDFTWSPAVVDVTPGGVERARLVSTAGSASGRITLVWQHGSTGSSDLHAQAIRIGTGTLGWAPLDLLLSGSCPGAVTITVRDCTPGRRVAILHARGAGSLRIPDGNPCAGTRLCLNATAQVGAILDADRSGWVRLMRQLPPAACAGRVLIQAIDVTTCGTSRPAATP